MSVPNRRSNSSRSATRPSASSCRMKGSKSPEAIASANVTRTTACPLVMIEWEDSAQPIPTWSYLASFEAPGTVRCVSVGWLIRDDGVMKVVAPNMGAVDKECSLQVSGMIQIPTSCILRVTELAEPGLTCP
jgi:hypothetical protein